MSLDTRRTRHGECVCACRRRDRRTHDEVGGARSARRLARGSALARRASPVSALTEPSRRCNAREGDVTRHTAHTTRRARVSTARSAHARRDRRRSVGTTIRSRLGARSASPAPALTEPCRRCDEERAELSAGKGAEAPGSDDGVVLGCPREPTYLPARFSRRMLDRAGGARSAERLARGSALARRRRCRL